MKDTVALERLAALHAGSGDAATFCQLCLRGEGDDGVRVASLGRLCAARAHLTCADCVSSIADAARPSASAASPAWGAIAGCPTCALPDTDAGMTRLFRRGRDASLPPGAPVVEAPEGPVAADRSSSALMTRDSLSRADVEALAGVLVAERARRLREDDDASASSSSSSSSADDDETDADPSGPTSWWPRRDVAAQLRSALGALPSLNALRTAAPGIFADLAVVSNGSALLGSGAGAEIDAHRCVARFNEYEIGGAFAEDVGERVDVHATGWLMAAARDDPKDRLAAEEEEEEEEGRRRGRRKRSELGRKRSTLGWKFVDEPGGSRSRSRARPRVEIRLMPNDPALGRAYFVSYLRAIAYHRRRWNNRRREKNASSERTSDASLSRRGRVVARADAAEGSARPRGVARGVRATLGARPRDPRVARDREGHERVPLPPPRARPRGARRAAAGGGGGSSGGARRRRRFGARRRLFLFGRRRVPRRRERDSESYHPPRADRSVRVRGRPSERGGRRGGALLRRVAQAAPRPVRPRVGAQGARRARRPEARRRHPSDVPTSLP